MADSYDLASLLQGAAGLPSLIPVDRTVGATAPRAVAVPPIDFADPALAFAQPVTAPPPGLPANLPAMTVDTSAVKLAAQQARELQAQQLRDARAGRVSAAAAAKAAKAGAPAALEAEINGRLGLDAATTDAAATAVLSGAKPRIDLTAKWTDVIGSQAWKDLPVEEQHRQQALWVDAQMKEVVARATATLQREPKKEVVAKYRQQLEASQASIAPTPKRDWFDSDIIDTAVNQAKTWWFGRKLRDADTTAQRQEALQGLTAARAEYTSSLSAYTNNEQKKLDLMRRDMMEANVAAGQPPELTPMQEVQMGWAAFKSDPWKAVLGNAPSTLAGMGSALAGGVVGALAGPGGAAVGAAAGGAAAGQEMTSAFTAAEIADRIAGTSDKDLARSPQYQELLAFHRGDATQARAALVQKLVDETELLARGVGAATGVAEAFVGAGKAASGAISRASGGAASTGLLARAFSRLGLPAVGSKGAVATIARDLQPVASGGLRSTVAHAAGEAGQEFVQEGAEQGVSNVAMNQAGLQDNLLSGVFEAGTAGALTGVGTYGGTKAAGAALQKVAGPVEDQGDVVVTRGADGKLTAARTAKTANGSNLVMDPKTGMTRLRDLTAAQDPQAVLLMSQLNMQLMQHAAAADGLKPEAGMLAGMGANALLLGDEAAGLSLPLNINGQRVGFTFAADGSVSVADPRAPMEAVQIARDANDMLVQISPAVVQFASKTAGYSAPTSQFQPPAPAPAPVAPAPQPAPVAPAPVAPAPQPAPVAPAPQPTPTTVAPAPQPAPFVPPPIPTPPAPAPVAPAPAPATVAPAPAPIAPPPIPSTPPTNLRDLLTTTYGLPEGGALFIANSITAYDPTDPVQVSRAQEQLNFASPQSIALRSQLMRAFEDNPEPLEQMAPGLAALLRTSWYGTAMSSPTGDPAPDASGELWQRVTKMRTNNRAGALLTGIAKDAGFSQAERNLAELLIKMFSSQGIPLPKVELAGTRGSYAHWSHTVTLPRNNARAGRVLHEFMHAATVHGLNRIDNASRQGNAQAKAFSDLVTEVHQAMVQQAAKAFGVTPARVRGDGNNPVYALRVYDRQGAVYSRPELQAELFNPMVLALAQQTPLSELQLSDKARSALGRIMTGSGTRDIQPGVTLYEAIVALVQDVLRWASGKPLTEPELSTVSEALAAIAAEAASETGRAFREANPVTRSTQGRGAGMTFGPADNTGDGNAVQVESPDAQVLGEQGQGLGLRQDGQGNQVDQGAAGSGQTQGFGQNQGPQALSPRAPGATLAAARAGRQAPAATVNRGLTQALTNKQLTPAQRRAAAMPYLRQLGDRLTEMFADALLPMVRWVQGLPVPEGLRNDLLGAMYRAPNVRDNITRQAMEQYGGEQLQQALAGLLATDRKRNPSATSEDVVFYAGYWLTAQYAPVKNRRMLQAAEDALIQAQQDLATAMQAGAPRADIVLLQHAVDEAQSVYDDRVHALAQPATVNSHVGVSGKPVGLAGGMNDAQAADFIRVAEQRYGRPALQAMARNVYRMNAFRLATDLETGRTSPELAAKFSPETEALRSDMDALVAAANNPRSNQAQLEKLRDTFVNKLASRSLYVPTSGDSSKALEQDVLGQGFKTPNVAKDKRLQGRTTSLADDGITASLGGMQRSAAAAGWDDFTRLVQRAYYDMTPDQRRAAGIKEVDITILDRLGDNLVIRGDKGYSIGDGKELAALRKENVDDRSRVWSIVEMPTRAFAYAATQLNPAFGVYNMVRDTWERSEFLRTRSLVNARGQRVDSTKAAQRMIQLVASGEVLRDVRQALWSSKPGAAAQNSKYAQLLREFEDMGGGGSKFAAALSRDRGQLAIDIEKAGSNTRRLLSSISKVVSRWNEVFDSVAALSAYSALREQGMSKEAAAAATLDLMNFRKGGGAMPAVRAFYAFAQPAVTGGVNMVRLLQTPLGRKRMLGYVIAFGVLQALMASLAGDDDELGRNKMDLLDEYTKDRSLPIPIPGTDMIAKLPIGFGMPMLANIISRQALEFGKGDITLYEAINEAAGRGVLPAFTPLEDVKIRFSDDPMRWLLQTVSPTIAKPLTNVAINRSGLGGEVVREAFLDKDKFKSEQGSPLTPEDYKLLATQLRSTFGIDLAPEQVREMVRGYSLGVFRTALQMAVEDPHKALTGRNTEIPIVRTLVSGYNSNALITEMSRFEREGQDLLRERNADPEGFVPNEREQSVLQLYEQWTEVEKDLRREAAGLTRAGVGRGVNPARLKLREQREAAQAGFVRQFNEIPR